MAPLAATIEMLILEHSGRKAAVETQAARGEDVFHQVPSPSDASQERQSRGAWRQPSSANALPPGASSPGKA